MKERFILFSREMVRALLDGRKTQTRRIVKLPHNNPLGQWEPTAIGGENGGRTSDGKTVPLQGGIWHTRTGECLMSPYGQPGDRLWVRETHVAFGRWETRFSAKKGRDEWHFVDMTLDAGFAYRFDGADPDACRRAGAAPTWHKRPSIFMPRAASRITLENVGVRVERLQDISEADAQAEGVERPRKICDDDPSTHVDAYADLWDSLNAARGYSFESNPYVWVISFRRIEPCNT